MLSKRLISCLDVRDGKLTDEARRRIEYELDLEEAGVANRGKDGGGWM